MHWEIVNKVQKGGTVNKVQKGGTVNKVQKQENIEYILFTNLIVVLI